MAATTSAFDDIEAAYACTFETYTGVLSAEVLMAKAEVVTGLSNWGGEHWGESGFRARLIALCNALESESQLTPLGRTRAHGRLLAALISRLRVLAFRQIVVKDTPIVAPLVGTGFPRAGTSFLHQLFAQDPDNLGAITSEAMIPVPPPGVLDNEVRRFTLVDRMLKFQGLDAPQVNAVHPIAADASDEDVVMQEAAIGSLYQAFFSVPSFLPALRETVLDLYQWQKGMMQLLQSERPKQRWVLKAPEHLSHWETMWQAFPDARVYLNHRDPAKVVASIASLYITFQALNTNGRPVPSKDLGPPMLQGLIAQMNHVATWRAAHPEVTIVDVHYKQMIADPIGEAERVYSAFDLKLSAQAKSRMQSFLKVNRHGQSHDGAKHSYRLQDFGLTEAMIEKYCGDYIDRNCIVREKRD